MAVQRNPGEDAVAYLSSVVLDPRGKEGGAIVASGRDFSVVPLVAVGREVLAMGAALR